jgi:transglutaminase-like putative cysteine protease/two-component sensor histidine kinase
MTRNIEIGGRSRRFRIVVLLAAIGVVFSAMVVVGAIAGTPGDVGVSIQSPGGEGGEGSGGSGFLDFSFGGNESNSSPSTPSPDEPRAENTATSPESKSLPVGDSKDTRDTLNAFDNTGALLSSADRAPGMDQFNLDSHRSFVDKTHFTVDTEAPGFWRVTTYDIYTSNGFVKAKEATPETTTPLPSSENATGPQGESDVFRLTSSASRLPATGTPQSIDIISGADPDAYQLRTGGDGTIIVTNNEGNIDTLPAGTVYRLSATNRDGGAQSNASDEEVRQRYLQTPDKQPDRIGELAGEIVNSSDADTNEEKAHAISNWLNENKEYRVNESHEPSENPVDEFLFEMDGGHTPYYTSSTAVMLREQGVPARVATGYTQGNVNESGVREVGSMEQHSWVEVYTEDGQWVTVDPAPTGEAQDVQESVRNGNESATKYGVNEDVINAWLNDDPVVTDGTPNTATERTTTKGTADPVPKPPYTIDVSPDPTPGGEVTVTVTKDGTSIAHARVQFNGEFVGRTNTTGQLTAQVPYTDSLTVTATQPGYTTDGTREQSSLNPRFGDRGGSLASTTPQASNGTNSSETYELPTNVSVDSDTVVLPGDELTSSFTINGTAVPGVDVYIEDKFVGRTDENGELTATIPDDVQLGENITVRVERDELSSTTTVQVASPEVQVDSGIIAIPGTTADVTVVAVNDGVKEPISNATVSVFEGKGTGTQPYADTVSVDENGTATIGLQWSNAMTVTASHYGTETTTVVSGLYYPLAAFVGVVFVLCIGGARYVQKKGVPAGVTEGKLREPELPTLKELKAKFYTILFGIADRFRAIGARISSAGHRISRTLSTFTAQLWQNIRRLNGRGVLLTLVSGPRRVFEYARHYLQSLAAFFREIFEGSGSGTVSENPPDVDSSRNGSGGDSTPTSYERIRGFWRWLVRFVIGRTGRNTQTTVEIGEKAINHGFPSGPVTRLRVAFQEIEYGNRDPDSRVDEAEGAVEDLRSSADNSEDPV